MQGEEQGRNFSQQSGKLLASFPRVGPNRQPQEFRVALDYYDGHPFVRLQVWAEGTKGWYPLKDKMATIRSRELSEAIEALQRAEAEIGAKDERPRHDAPARQRDERPPHRQGGRQRQDERAGKQRPQWVTTLPEIDPSVGPGFDEFQGDDG